MGDLQRLTELCPPPVGRLGEKPVKTTGALTLPGQHRELLDTYGSGCFDEFLWIYDEQDENPNLDIAMRTESTREILKGKTVTALRRRLEEYTVGTDDLVQWGGSDNGDSLLWIPRGDPGDWPTVVIEAGQLDFAVLSRNSTGIILDLLSGVQNLDIFSDDFPSRQPEFSADPYS